jgi:uncharacterized protein (DUF2164 family)
MVRLFRDMYLQNEVMTHYITFFSAFVFFFITRRFGLFFLNLPVQDNLIFRSITNSLLHLFKLVIIKRISLHFMRLH